MPINQLKAGAILSYVSIGLNNIVGLLYTPFMLRMLGQNEYGLYSLVASVVSYLTVLDLGFANAIVRYTAKFRAEGKIREQCLYAHGFYMACSVRVELYHWYAESRYGLGVDLSCDIALYHTYAEPVFERVYQ